jgi:hypothetical protein
VKGSVGFIPALKHGAFSLNLRKSRRARRRRRTRGHRRYRRGHLRCSHPRRRKPGLVRHRGGHEFRALNEAADGLVLVEQPVPHDDVTGLRRVREATGVPVMADESCFSPSDVASLARQRACDVVETNDGPVHDIEGPGHGVVPERRTDG